MPERIEVPPAVRAALQDPVIRGALEKALPPGRRISHEYLALAFQKPMERKRILAELQRLSGRKTLLADTRERLESLIENLLGMERSAKRARTNQKEERESRTVPKQRTAPRRKKGGKALLFLAVGSAIAAAGGIAGKRYWSSLSDSDKYAVATKVSNMKIPFVSDKVKEMRDKAVADKFRKQAGDLSDKAKKALEYFTFGEKKGTKLSPTEK